MEPASYAIALLACAVGAWLLFRAARRAWRTLVTLRASALTPRLSRLLSRCVGAVHYSADELLRADGAGPAWIPRRRAAIDQLARALEQRFARSVEWGNRLRDGLSDLRFTDANRVPFPFARLVRERFNLCSVVTASKGPRLLDLDGNWTLDVSGAYGVNVAGFDQYKEWMQRGLDRVADVGPVLGPLHPVVAENVEILKRISGLEEVSFHMSGTEAVMAAVRMIRHSTRRRHIVCFSGAYHGWWDGVQPGLGSERELSDCLTLKDLDPASLDVIRWRADEIAGVLVNPVQCFHPNAPPPSDAVLLTSDVRKTEDSTARYSAWLARLREVCTRQRVPLIFDEVYTGFRLAPGGAQEFFGVRADVVVYGKTVAGGMPIGVVCGRSALMQRFDPRHPMRIAYVIGTFSAHPAVMGAMREFLAWLCDPVTAERYRSANRRCGEWIRSLNAELADASLPIRLVNLGTVWTVLFKEPSRYNWLLQYYLRAEGLTLSWVGTGRCLCSMDFGEGEYRELGDKILEAARKLRSDGWWPSEQDDPGREGRMRMRLVRELLGSLIPVPVGLKAFVSEVIQRKHDDHEASHHNPVNQLFHLISSSVFIYCYGALAIAGDVTQAMWLGLPALFLRQLGHAVFEPPCHDREASLLGFSTRSKTAIVLTFLGIPLVHASVAVVSGWPAWVAFAAAIGWQWLAFTLAVVLGRVVYLVWKHGLWSSSVWFVKLVTDPFSDVVAYSPRLRRI
jgi:glutamate-1-semialdehyde 2,1-aminomutase